MMLKALEKDKDIESVIQFGSSLNKKSPSDIDICIFTKTKMPLNKKLAIISRFPSKYDVNFFDDLPLDLKKRVLSEGKILFTNNYYNLLEIMKIVDYEYPRYKAFLADYHRKKMAGMHG